MRSIHKMTFEDKFARHYYCNAHRFTGKMKKANNKRLRKIFKDVEV